MTAVAPDAEELRELDDDTRRAWKAYMQHLRELEGEAYERAERDCWARLQRELQRLERRRQALHRAGI